MESGYMDAIEKARAGNAAAGMAGLDQAGAQAYAREEAAKKAKLAAEDRIPAEAFKDIEARDEYRPLTNEFVKKGSVDDTASSKADQADSMNANPSHETSLTNYLANRPGETAKGADYSNKPVTDSASELINAKPDKVGAVIDKLKAESQKGGPSIFDIIEAAAAGWNGRVPMKVQKELAKKAQEAEMQKMQESARLNAEEMAKQYGYQQKLQTQAQANEERLLRERLAAEYGTPLSGPSMSRLSLAGLTGGK